MLKLALRSLDGASRVEDRLRRERGRTEYYFTIPKRCDAAPGDQDPGGATNYVCGVYETRPQMCRDYDGRMEGPQGVADCLWRLDNDGRSLPEQKAHSTEAS